MADVVGDCCEAWKRQLATITQLQDENLVLQAKIKRLELAVPAVMRIAEATEARQVAKELEILAKMLRARD